MRGTRILVTGGAGFIGRHTVAALRAAGYGVRVLVRHAGQAAAPGVEVAIGHMNDPASLREACTGCAGVIHLAAHTRDGPDADRVNVGGAACLIEACKAADCRRVVVVSTQSAKIERKGDYARTKAAADALFLASGLEVTLMLPSVVYGTLDDGIFGVLRRVVASHRVVPVLGDGRWRCAPVHVDDVAGALVRALDVPASIGRSYDLAGPQEIGFDALLDRIAQAQALPAPWKLHVPLSVSLAAADLLARLMKSPPISRSNVLGSNQDTHIDIGRARQDLDFDPMPLAAGLEALFGRIDDLAALRAEATALSRYLMGTAASPEIVQRYVDAHRVLLPATPDRITAFVRAHPWSAGLLDAAAAPRGMREPFRQRVLLMASVLEATPEHALRFLPASRSRFATLALLGWHGLRAVALAALGMPLYLLLRTRPMHE
ncbi:NAD(P)-dependent oxidoreductase [Variovorax sp. OV329]|uniref:NAD-dependent epimerase/dehydratase family protein n=1 Tax=Variovorax sp. OV329 TaxID=1882825 RepID=UPI0008E11215|nr:NAD-dependent epimerase/dehydratase family protein [Variovorax sp. OV329]SFL87548.1 Nucleoside-diphosphate-sugar epimerase [Variovorax sp. OV329]